MMAGRLAWAVQGVVIFLVGTGIFRQQSAGLGQVLVVAAALALFGLLGREMLKEPPLVFVATDKDLAGLWQGQWWSLTWAQLKEVRWRPRDRVLEFCGPRQVYALPCPLDPGAAEALRTVLKQKKPSLKLQVWD